MGPRRLRLGVAAAWAALACSSPSLVLTDGRYTHAKLGAAFEDPARIDPGWRLVALEPANAAFAGPGGAVMSWVRECRESAPPPPRWLARTLLLDAPGAVVTKEEAREVDGAPGWEIFAHVPGKGAQHALHAVLRAGPRCSDDWVLVAPGSTDAHEALFERWRASFADGAGGG